jgi:hypothetical protein
MPRRISARKAVVAAVFSTLQGIFSQSSGNVQGMFKQPYRIHPIFPDVNNTRPDRPTAASAGAVALEQPERTGACEVSLAAVRGWGRRSAFGRRQQS